MARAISDREWRAAAEMPSDPFMVAPKPVREAIVIGGRSMSLLLLAPSAEKVQTPWLQRTSSDQGVGTGAVVATALLVAVLVGALVVVLITAHRTRKVMSASSAVRNLLALNQRSREHLLAGPALRHEFRYRAESKGKFDRFDLSRFLSDSVLDNEAWFSGEVNSRLRVLQLHQGYLESVRRLEPLLGRSTHPSLSQERFETIERKLFLKKQIQRPNNVGRVVAHVTYTSPQGRNSYARSVQWDFDALVRGLHAGQEFRASQSTAMAMRARERRLMTPSLRSDILRRDGYRCKMCGAASSDGVNLHIDHIVPVSHGGRTLEANLQTLCQSCNLGKGNRFSG